MLWSGITLVKIINVGSQMTFKHISVYSIYVIKAIWLHRFFTDFFVFIWKKQNKSEIIIII